MPSLSLSLKTTRSRLQETSEAGCGATVRSDRKQFKSQEVLQPLCSTSCWIEMYVIFFRSVCIGTAKQKKPSEARRHTKIQVNSESYSEFTSLSLTELWTLCCCFHPCRQWQQDVGASSTSDYTDNNSLFALPLCFGLQCKCVNVQSLTHRWCFSK